MTVATFDPWRHVEGLAAPDPPPGRFVRGGVLFIVDRSVPAFVGYEWIDDHTVRIHPDAVREMEFRLSVGDDD